MTCLRISLLLLCCLMSTPRSALAVDLDNGRKIYEKFCLDCHGPTGTSDFPETPDLARGRTMFRTDSELMTTILHGQRTMPGFRSLLDRESLIDVLHYIRSLGG